MTAPPLCQSVNTMDAKRGVLLPDRAVLVILFYGEWLRCVARFVAFFLLFCAKKTCANFY